MEQDVFRAVTGINRHLQSISDNPQERLRELASVKADAAAEIRITLERVAARYGISSHDVAHEFMRHVPEMLNDLLYEAKRRIECETLHNKAD